MCLFSKIPTLSINWKVIRNKMECMCTYIMPNVCAFLCPLKESLIQIRRLDIVHIFVKCTWIISFFFFLIFLVVKVNFLFLSFTIFIFSEILNIRGFLHWSIDGSSLPFASLRWRFSRIAQDFARKALHLCVIDCYPKWSCGLSV